MASSEEVHALLLPCGGLAIASLSYVALSHFTEREINHVSFFAALLGFVLSFGIIALVPYDVWATLATEASLDQNVEPPSQVLVVSSWAAIYWATFLLCWLLCPILIEYEAAGDFSPRARLRASIRRNAKWHAGYLCVGSMVLIWISLSGGVVGSLSAWCIAASNAWGLFVSTVLMGYGLVAVPRHLWRMSNPGSQLKSAYCSAVAMDEARLSTQFELQDVINEARSEVSQRCSQTWDPGLERAFAMLQQTLEDCEQLHCELTNGARPRQQNNLPRNQSSSSLGRCELEESAARIQGLASLRRTLKRVGLEARRATCRWDELVQKCLLLEDLEEEMYPSALQLASHWQGPWARAIFRVRAARSCYQGFAWLWLKNLRPYALRAASACCGILSVVIVLGQLTMFSSQWTLSLLSLFFRRDSGFGTTQVLCMVPLSYMVCTAFWSIFRLKVAGWYGLYANHNTDTGSVLWCASLLARLAAPLCYHFLLLIRVKGTAFQSMMGQMNVVPVLGQQFNEIFPIFVGVLCVCNLLNVYSRLVKLFGLDSLEFEWAPSAAASTEELVAEGRHLIERERRRRNDERDLVELRDMSGEGGRGVPLRLQIAYLIEEGLLPHDWNSASI
mmetsp:Transcript_20771/g.45709  ORF Transcript_20771/g.45709 Transcript_20771/m.45709 type:complete len:618 (+) Transcript_20771:22-1875(+)